MEALVGPAADTAFHEGAGAYYDWYEETRSPDQCKLQARVYGRQINTLKTDCPPDVLVELGLLELPPVDGVHADYARFYEVYRFSTVIQEVRSFSHDDFSVTFAALMGATPAHPVSYAILFAPGSMQSFWTGNPTGAENNALTIPQSQTQVGQARLLIEGKSPIVLTAIQDLPLNVPAASNLMLSVPAEVMYDLATTESSELLLPSGVDFALSEETLEALSNMVGLVAWPTWATRYAETGSLQPNGDRP